MASKEDLAATRKQFKDELSWLTGKHQTTQFKADNKARINELSRNIKSIEDELYELPF